MLYLYMSDTNIKERSRINKNVESKGGQVHYLLMRIIFDQKFDLVTMCCTC